MKPPSRLRGTNSYENNFLKHGGSMWPLKINYSHMKKRIILTLTTIVTIGSVCTFSQNVDVKKIWDKAPHNAFTDMIRYKSYFYCTFREGNNHVPRTKSDNGTIRVIRSSNGTDWEPVALLSDEIYDLRDPKISVTPDKKLMIIMGGSNYSDSKLIDMMPHVSFSGDGLNFSRPLPVTIEKGVVSSFDWIWRVTWKSNTGYGVVYQSRQPDNRSRIRLLATRDGKSYSQVSELDVDSLPNESTIRFDKKGNMLILVRREAKANGLLGISKPPYTDWKWISPGYRLGGPNFLVYGKNKLIIGTRLYKTSGASTVVNLTDLNGKIEKKIELPSGGDTSYPGLVIWRNILWVSYYSSHEGKTSIYLAKIKVNDLGN